MRSLVHVHFRLRERTLGMKTLTRLGIVGFVCLIGILLTAANPREDQWKKVEEAMKKGLPQTAIKHLDPIIEQAMKDKAYPEAIKAISRKIALEGNIQGNKPEEKITRMQAEIAKAPPEMVPVMDAILANWYWHFYQQNRWRFMQRTATATPPGDDILSWDLRRIFAEIDKQFTKALAAEQVLKGTPIAEYSILLEKGTMPDAYRPTLFDFVAHEALAFYVSGEQGLAKAEDQFELDANSPIFGSVDEFLKWEPKTTDKDSRVVKAIKLYQNLLTFHKDRKDKSAFLDTDLGRLAFGNNKAVGETKSANYKKALEKFTTEWKQHETSALARYRLGNVHHGEGEMVEARKIALEGNKAFPDSPGGKLCFNLVQQIEAKSSNINTERVWNNPWPNITLRYRNVNKVYFRAIKSDWVARLGQQRQRPEWLSDADRKELLTKQADKEWSADLPATEDYKERTEDLTAPKDLKPGFYFLLASHDEKFSNTNNVVTYTDFWVSDLAVVMRSEPGSGKIEGFVLDANTGEPIDKANVQTWVRNNNNVIQPGPAVATDKNGLFSTPAVAQNGHLILVTHKDQTLGGANDYYNSGRFGRAQPHTRTVFFTDRSLYRPGQTIQFKGLCINTDMENDNYKTMANEKVTIVFVDHNGKEVARQQLQSNEYGSFSGSFNAPRDRLMGQMHLQVQGGPPGAAHFNVEEYKRPKFEVKLDAPKEAAKLNGDVSLQGKATAYTGAAIGNAQVRYRVVRQVRYPDWWGWCYWWRQPKTDSQEIAHGTAMTEADGTFPIKFVAKPDLTVPEKDEPTFHYTIHADVTDTTGETRSADRTINVAYTALKASMSASDWLTDAKDTDINVTTTTHDGEGQQAKTTVKVYKLKQPDKVERAPLGGGYYGGRRGGRIIAQPKPDPSNVHSWALGEVVTEKEVVTDANGKGSLAVKLEAGVYRAMLETKDRFGKTVTAQLPVQVLKPDAKKYNVKVPNLVTSPKWTVEPGEDFMALWGTGYDSGRAFVEVEHRGKVIQSYWTDPQVTQTQIKQKVEESMRGGFTMRVTMVRENRAYLAQHHVNVPWTNKQLSIKWEHFTSKLEPGKKETWTAVISGPDAKKAVAEMVATLYDQSLDAYLPHQWHGVGNFRHDYGRIGMQFENMVKGFQYIHGQWPSNHKDVQISYRKLPRDLSANLRGYEYFDHDGTFTSDLDFRRGAFGGRGNDMANAAPGMDREMAKGDGAPQTKPGAAADPGQPAQQGGQEGQAQPNLEGVTARKNLNETAFFFPHLISDAEGKVKLEFTMPEALTRWKFMGLAHDKELRNGFIQDEVVTAKDLMVQPNPPRFIREGDSIEFTVKVSNQSKEKQSGTVRLTFADARTSQSVDQAVGNTITDQAFDIPSLESKTFSWLLKVPDGLGPLTYKAVAASNKVSDGEEAFLPVLSRYVLVTESIPLPIRGVQTKKFDFPKLANSGKSDTLKHQSLTVQMTSNPAWYAIMALPYLMEYPYDCSEQVFNRLYANTLARHIANSDPKIRKVFNQWKDTPALDSPLEKNQDLKSVVLEETPWLRQAQAESQARKNVGILFDDNRLDNETARMIDKLRNMQLADGSWPWFPGGPGNDYITLYITTGFGRLRHLGVKIDSAMAIKAIGRLDGWIDRVYDDIVKHNRKDQNNLSPTIAMYLYGRSFFLADQPIHANAVEAVEYFQAQGRTHWLKLANRQSQAHLAVALQRFGDKNTPKDIMKSMKERSVSNEEMGMFWRDTELSYWWYRAPIETQAMMIEAFDEVMNDKAAVEDCKVWLLKQKQTQDWKTTKATADAVYGLLLRGTDLLKSDALVEVTLGDLKIEPKKVEAGTGFYEQRFPAAEVKPAMAAVTVKKTDEGVAWGSVHWQYLEDMAKVTPHDGTPLKLTKTLFTKEYTKAGPVLKPVTGNVKVGDELVVRIVLKSDRDMEYVHMKDYRGSGTEPTNVLSRYRYQDGLGYYETTRDTASHFFIDYLPKGTYVFEYSVRVQLKGQYQTGYASIQCMYAPEFNSHSESLPLDVK